MCCEHTCALQPHELVQLRLKVHGICFAPSEVKCFRFWEELWWCCCGGAVVVVLSVTWYLPQWSSSHFFAVTPVDLSYTLCEGIQTHIRHLVH